MAWYRPQIGGMNVDDLRRMIEAGRLGDWWMD